MKTNDHRPIAPGRLRALVEGLPRPDAAPRPGPSSAPHPEPPSARLRASPDRSNSRVLVVIGVIAAIVAGAYLWAARPRPAPSPEPPVRASLAATASATRASAPDTRQVVVHVLGKVRRPGVITLPSGARVAEAIKAAGGVRPGAGTGSLNLARTVVDGEQIPVGIRTPPSAPGAAVPGSPASPGPGAPLDLNTATAEQLDGLPGVGPVLAQRILGYRTQHGGFRSVDQLQEVNGIGARRFADLRPMVRV